MVGTDTCGDAKRVLFCEVDDLDVAGAVGVALEGTLWASDSKIIKVSSSAGDFALFRGRPLFLFGGASVSTSAALDSAAPALASWDSDRAALLMGVPARLIFGVAPTSDFLGRPRPRLTRTWASGSLSGTVVVCVLVKRFTLGDLSFSSLPGSAWTVTLMRHGLALPILGVFMIMALEGDENSNSDTLDPRFCLLGDVVISALRGVFLRGDFVVVFSVKEMASGSGLESGVRSTSLIIRVRPRKAIVGARSKK
jgi:hypothetical protein